MDTGKGNRRIALITNHGYAGVTLPVGGAPDTGGQNFYVNSLASALEASGLEVTVFARGGFPFFKSSRIREGIEKMSPRVRYVYVPGGGPEFIPKEDIGVALDEEVKWMQDFIQEEAAQAGIKSWQYYRMVNTHYWDGAIMGLKLIERWQDEAARDFLSTAVSGRLKPYLAPFEGEEVHKQGLAVELNYHLGTIMETALKEKILPRSLIKQLDRLIPEVKALPPRPDSLQQTMDLGGAAANILEVDGSNLPAILKKINTHVWTPHSIGIIKERNFWYKDPASSKKLKFREREAHERLICDRVKLFCSTSTEIYRALVSYHKVSPRGIFDFPPCIDQKIFRPRPKQSLSKVYQYLSNQSGLPEAVLKKAQIIFETSRMDKTKRKDILLKAFARVAEATEEVFLFIGGGPEDGPVFRDLSKLRQARKILQKRAFLLGFVPEEILGELFSVADIFVSTSEMEGFGMSASQAAASGVAVIASDLIPFATQLAGDAAVIVPAGDVEGFAREMKNLLSNEGERKSRSEKLYQIARNLNWNDTAQSFIQWFNTKQDHVVEDQR